MLKDKSMKSLPAILLFATACGQDTTSLEVTCAESASLDDEREASTEFARPSSGELAAGSHPVPSDPTPESTPPAREAPGTLVLSPSNELLGPVRAAAARFAERLEIPMVVGEGGIPVTVQEGVYFKGKPYSALASYTHKCTFADCNSRVSIVIDRSMLTTKSYNLAPVLDHEIGHVLSAWGHVKKVDMHVQEEYHVMSAGVLRGVEWTQQDIDLWCSASPCGRTELDEEWTYPVLPPVVSDGGTSYLSDSGVDAGG